MKEEDDAVDQMRANYADYAKLRDLAERHLNSGEFNTAAVYVEAAARIASSRHCGMFSSRRLERVLLEIARRTQDLSGEPSREPRTSVVRVLHVCTTTHAVGGMTRMLCRWISRDAGRQHSIALIKNAQPAHTLNQVLRDRGGTLHCVGTSPGGPVEWARRLRRISLDYDVVILHVSSEESVPTIAFAEPRNRPPTLLVNHGDHLFWLGVETSDLVVSSRRSADRIVCDRRGVDPERSAILPILIDAPVRKNSREEAKNLLGIDPETVLICSVARAVKYTNVGGVTFADAHVSVLKSHPNATLLVAGAGERADWQPAVEQTNGRILTLPEMDDPSVVFEAADIYTDSYPFVSITSALEGGSYGVPVVSRFPHSKDADIMSVDMPGLTGCMVTVASDDEYTSTLSTLIANRERRVKLGEQTRFEVVRHHVEPSWREALETIYNKALAVEKLNPSLPTNAHTDERISHNEGDIMLTQIFNRPLSISEAVKSYMRMMPARKRLETWLLVLKTGGFSSRKEAAMRLLPEWTVNFAKIVFRR